MKSLLKWFLISSYTATRSTDEEINKGFIIIILVMILALFAAIIVS